MTDFVDPQTMNLVVTNVVLGLACAVLLAIVVIGIAVQLIGRRGGTKPDDPPSPTHEPPRPERTLADQRGELPDGWPPVPESRPKACGSVPY